MFIGEILLNLFLSHSLGVQGKIHLWQRNTERGHLYRLLSHRFLRIEKRSKERKRDKKLINL